MSGYKKIEELKFTLKNGIELEFGKRGKEAIGITEVCYKGLRLRNPNIPIIPYIDTPEGFHYTRFEYKGYEIKGASLVIHTQIKGHWANFAEWWDIASDPILITQDWGRNEISDELDWIISPHIISIGDKIYTGFTYQFQFKSRINKIHRLLDRATWELGGQAQGNNLIYRAWANLPEYEVKRGTQFTTEAITSENQVNRSLMWGDPKENPHINSLLPRWALHQTFDYQWGRKGTLVGYFARVGLIKSQILKERGRNVIKHFDLHIFPLSNRGTTIPKHIVFNPDVPLDITDARNQWTEVFDYVEEKAREEMGIQDTVPYPQLSQDCWYEHTFKDFEIDLIPLAERLGFKRVYIGPIWENDTSETGETKRFNHCCTWDFEVPQKYGGTLGLKKLCDLAHKKGLEVCAWYGTYFGINSPVLISHPDWSAKREDKRTSYHSGYVDTLVAGDLNTPFFDYLIEKFKKVKKLTGLDVLCQDSYANLGFWVTSYGNSQIIPNALAQIRLQKKLQKMGYKLEVEAVSTFGLSGVGMFNDYYIGHEPIAYKAIFGIDFTEYVLKGKIDVACYYRFVANKAPLVLALPTDPTLKMKGHNYKEKLRRFLKAFTAEFVRVNKDYNTVINKMEERRLLSGEKGVEWRNSKDRDVILFSYKKFKYKLNDKYSVTDITTGKNVENKCDTFITEPLHTYWMKRKRLGCGR